MAFAVLLAVCIGTAIGAPSGVNDKDAKDVDFLMPGVAPQQPDTYLCIPMKMKSTPEYIVGFKPHADMAIAHHILLYGCAKPGSRDPVWNCGEMASHGNSQYKSGQVCGSGSRILYAWAMDAPSLKLPKDVGFKVGGDTGIDYLVLQVHYKNVTKFKPPISGDDSSGITMTMTDQPQPRRAGVYLIGTSGVIPKDSITFLESTCVYNEDFDVYPFAFRTHAHKLGKVTSGYRIRNGQWTEIGRKSPQLPQMFYNSTTPGIDVKKGDILKTTQIKMAAMGDDGSQSTLDPDNATKQARMLQEAVIGKIPEDDAMDNLVDVEMNLDYAAINILSQDKYQHIRFPTQEEVINDLHSKFEDKTETRLFSCKDCDRYWWRRVPSRKKVSKCRLCFTRYEAIPRGMEWGICKYKCNNCGHEFRGFGSMGSPAGSPCYKCYSQCLPLEVIPSNRRRMQVRTQNTHRCSGHNCWRHGGGHSSGECSHPKSTDKKVLVASDKHISTGSTVNTFLSQGSLEERFEPGLPGIDE